MIGQRAKATFAPQDQVFADMAPKVPCTELVASNPRGPGAEVPAAPASAERRVSRGALASTTSSEGGGKSRPYPPHGVHFSEAAQAPQQVAPVNTAAKTMPLSEQLVRELELLSPSLTMQRAAQIEEVLAELHAACQACTLAAGHVGPSGDVGQLLPLGAYRLGVMLPGDEVDVLFVAPLTVQLRDLPNAVLGELERKVDLTGVSPPGSDGLFAAPGLRFTMRGVSVCLLMAQRISGVPQPRPEAIVQNTTGLLAREVVEQILARVPSVKQFRFLLRFVRYWARQRGVYGHYLGFLGGTAWAICCARICQMNPHLELSQLAARFFRTLSRWDWRQPVALLPIGAGGQPAPDHSTTGLVTGSFSTASMAVILPLEPPLPATPHITETTARIVQKELRRGYKMVQQVELSRSHWADVYATARFFQRHRHYLEFDFVASSEAVLSAWLAWGKQQMQDLVHLFESMSSNIVTLRPWPEWIEFKDASWPYARAVFVGLHLERGDDTQTEGVRRSFDLREPIVKFLEAISAWPDADRHTNQFELLIRHVRLAELEQCLENQGKGLVANRQLSNIGTPGVIAGGGTEGWQRRSLAWPITEDDDGIPHNLEQCSL